MNKVSLEGRMTKEPWVSDKGWATFTLAVPKPGSTYSTWIPVYVPASVAASLGKFSLQTSILVEGELDQKKDKTLQVKASTIRASGTTSRPLDSEIPY